MKMTDIEIQIKIILEMYSRYEKEGPSAEYPQSEFQEKFNVSKDDAGRNFDYLEAKGYVKAFTFGPNYVITGIGVEKAKKYKKLMKLFDLRYEELREKCEKEISEKESKISEDFSMRGLLYSGPCIDAIFKLNSKTYKQFLEKHIEDSKEYVEDEESLTILRNHLSERIPIIANIIKRKMEEICLQKKAGEYIFLECRRRVDELKHEWLSVFSRNLEIFELSGFKKNSFSEQAFVLMPFEEPFNSYYEKIIKPSIEKAGIKCLRADEIYEPGDIPEQIYDNLKRSKIIVADITKENMNVIYEVGVAHTYERDVIFLTQKKPEAAPFYVRHHRIIQYNPDEDGWEPKLEEELSKYIKSLLI